MDIASHLTNAAEGPPAGDSCTNNEVAHCNFSISSSSKFTLTHELDEPAPSNFHNQQRGSAFHLRSIIRIV